MSKRKTRKTVPKQASGSNAAQDKVVLGTATNGIGLDDWELDQLPAKLQDRLHHLTALPTIPSPLANVNPAEQALWEHIAAGNKTPTPKDRVYLAFRALCESSRDTTLIQDLSVARVLISEAPKRAVYATTTVVPTAITVPYPVSNDANNALPVHLGKFARFSSVRLPCTIHLGVLGYPCTPVREGFSDRRTGAAIRLYPLRHRETRRIRHFIYNDVHDNMFVNGENVGIRTLAGPLSEFAIIQVGRDVVFWWSHGQGYDYRPNSQERKRSSDDFSEDSDPDDAPRSPRKKAKSSEGSAPPTTWEHILRRGLERWAPEYEAKKRTRNFRGSKGAELPHVVEAIASIAAPLRWPTAFGYSDLFGCDSKELQVSFRNAACGQHERAFLMPLFFSDSDQKALVVEDEGSPESKGEEEEEEVAVGNESESQLNDKAKSKKNIINTLDVGMGHIILAIAEKPRGDRPKAKNINITIYDSRPESVERKEIEDKAKGVVRYSGWLGMSADDRPRVWDVDPKFNKVKFETKYPNQGENSLDCGVYTVLKAWAYLLNIDVIARSDIRLPDGKTLHSFQRMARMIANYAAAGCMDTLTIQAFMAFYGYSTNQSLNKRVTRVDAIEMPDRSDAMDDSMYGKRLADIETTRRLDHEHQARGGTYLW